MQDAEGPTRAGTLDILQIFSMSLLMEQGQLGCDALCHGKLCQGSGPSGFSWTFQDWGGIAGVVQAKAWSIRESWDLRSGKCGSPIYFQYLPRNTESGSINTYGKIWIDEWIWQEYQVGIPSLMGKARMEIRCCVKSLWKPSNLWSLTVPGLDGLKVT